MTAVIAFLSLALTPAALDQQTLPELVRQHGDISKQIINDWSPADLPEIATSADVIARVVILDAESQLTSDQRSIETIYKAQVLSAVKSSLANISDGSAITFRKDGGTVSIEGRQITARDADFPPLNVGDEYVVFLWHDPKTRLLHVHYGAQGVFLISKGYVEQLSRAFGKWNQERGHVALAEFLGEVRAVTAAKQP